MDGAAADSNAPVLASAQPVILPVGQ